MRPRKQIILFSTNEITISLTRMLLETRYICKVHIATSIDEGNRIFQKLETAGREVDVVLIDGAWVTVAYQLRIDRQIPVVVFGIIPATAEYVAHYTVPSGPAEFSYRLLEAVKMACKRKRGPKVIRPVEKVPVVARQAA
jgi:hypothetical protein